MTVILLLFITDNCKCSFRSLKEMTSECTEFLLELGIYFTVKNRCRTKTDVYISNTSINLITMCNMLS